MTPMNTEPELSECDITTLFRRRTELQKSARLKLEEIERIDGEITRRDQERVRLSK